MQAAESHSLLGFTLDGRYTILREIGRGGMGVVYEAEHADLGKRVAVKVLLDKYADDDEAIARFKREALAASRIGNPHIIDVSHIGEAPDGRPFVVMELLDGEPLSKVLERTGQMPAWRAVHIMRQVLRAVGAAHSKGIIHRDLKPDNIFIVNRDDQHDFVKLLDFGISKIVDTGEHMAATRLTTTGVVMGTPLYMSPEQATGAAADTRVDIYASGVILFELLAGRPPFDETNYNLLVAKLITASPPHLDDLRKGLPPALVAAVHRALEKEPEARFATAEGFAQALPSDRAISEPNLELEGTIASGASVRAVPTTLKRSSPRKLWLIAGAAAVVALGAVITIAAIGTGGDDPQRADPPADKVKPPSNDLVPAKVEPTTPPPKPNTPEPPAPVPVGKIEVKTNPTGAAVKLDGVDIGSTPIEATVKPGPHHLHVELAGYAAVDEDETIHEAERTTAVITLVKASRSAGHSHQPRPVVTTTTTPNPKPPTAHDGGNPQNPYDGSNAPADTRDTPPGSKPNPYGSKPNPYTKKP